MNGVLSAAAIGVVAPGKRTLEAVDTLLAHMHKDYKHTEVNAKKGAAYGKLFGAAFYAPEGQLHAQLTMAAV